MALNAYDPCPCGSGKKFKWCCQPYFDQVERALDLHQQGQHESSLRVMELVTTTHPNQPQVWGYYANLLNAEGQTEKAEEAISKALELDPNFGMGHLLRGIFRQQEGEVIGALLLFRKAAEAYSPEAADQLVQVYEMIARNEILLNRPVAGRAALERAVHFSPGDSELREQFQAMFGPDARLPEAARKKYVFRPTAKPVDVDAAATGKLSDARKAFDALTKQVPDDPAAWFDLGIVRAWLGEQPGAVEALTKSLELEWDDKKAEETAALIEVLKCGQGMENESDYIEHRVYMQVRDPQVVFGLLQQWANERKIIAPQADPNTGYFSCLVAEELPSLLETGTTMARVTANLTIAGGLLRLWHPDQASVQKVATDIRDRVNLAVGEPSAGTGPAQFGDIVLEALAYPTQTADVAAAEGKLKDHARHYFEDVWAHRPLRALGGATPLDAAGSKLLRKRLLGVVRFLEECVAGAAPRKQAGNDVVAMEVYDFNQLRHKLGAELQAPGDAPTIHVPEDAKPAPVKRDFAAMSAADLAAVPADQLGATELEDAMRAALKLDARELAVAFAKAGAAKPADPAKPDRYPLFACLIAGATSEGDSAAAIKHADEGAKYDAEHNDGKRVNDYALRKAQLLAKRGDVDAAAAEFEGLIARNPDEPKFLVTATEAMLSAKQGAKALHFAEMGLEKARSSGNRDLEGACRELSEAAKRQMK
jgi:tetratricopeptide (TPR) repeat protein